MRCRIAGAPQRGPRIRPPVCVNFPRRGEEIIDGRPWRASNRIMGRYERPHNLGEALEILDSGRYTILAGGTDFYPARSNQAITEDVLDVTAIADLRGIAEEPEYWRIGPLTTWSDLVAAK